MVARKPSGPGLARAAAISAVVATVALASIAATDANPSPGAVPRWVILTAVYGTTAAIGCLGAIARRTELLAAAGAIYLPGALLAFSGVTLMFLLPASMFIAASTRRSEAGLLGPGGGLRLVALVGLVLGAGAALLTMTETVCWQEWPTAAGSRIVRVPATDEGSISLGPNGPIAAGCDGGVTRPDGIVLGGILLGGAASIAALAVVLPPAPPMIGVDDRSSEPA